MARIKEYDTNTGTVKGQALNLMCANEDGFYERLKLSTGEDLSKLVKEVDEMTMRLFIINAMSDIKKKLAEHPATSKFVDATLKY